MKINIIFQPKVFDGCHHLTKKVMILNDIIIVSIKKMIIEFIEGINIVKNSDFGEWSGSLWNCKIVNSYVFT